MAKDASYPFSASPFSFLEVIAEVTAQSFATNLLGLLVQFCTELSYPDPCRAVRVPRPACWLARACDRLLACSFPYSEG